MSEQTDLLDLLAATPAAGRQDEQTTRLLAVIAGDPVHAEDRRRVVAAIVADADTNGGQVDPNRVRAALTNDHGLDVTPQGLSATYSALRVAGAIEATGWGWNADTRSRNSGKPMRLYRLTDRRAAA